MQPNHALIAHELERSAEAFQGLTNDLSEFHGACVQGDYRRTDDLRIRMQAQLDACCDLYSAACRHLEPFLET